jgi:hypothetical protein
MDLVTNGIVITDPIKFAQQKKELLKINSDMAVTTTTENTTDRVF